MIIPLYDRSRVTKDWSCHRSRYWQYEYDGRGIVPSTSRTALFYGLTFHDCLSEIATLHRDGAFIDIKAIAKRGHDQIFQAMMDASQGGEEAEFKAREQGTLIQGIVLGFYKHVWPRLMAEYPIIIFIEEELTYEHDGLMFMAKPDLILSNGEDTVYVEYKSTSYRNDDWVNQWDTAIQLHSTVKAVEQSKGVIVDKVIIQGLYKGSARYGRQNSPFCYAYRRKGQAPFTEDQVSYTYKAGWPAAPVWELEGGIEKWVEEMPLEVLQAQFPQTPPIVINDAMVSRFFAQTSAREWEIFNTINHPIGGVFDQEDLDSHFPQNFDTCHEVYGGDCEYIRLCHGNADDPLSQGFERREAHHLPEKERHDLEDAQEDLSSLEPYA